MSKSKSPAKGNAGSLPGKGPSKKNISLLDQMRNDAQLAVAAEKAQEQGPDRMPYTGLFSTLPIVTIGSRMLRGGIRSYTPCVLDRTGWENYFLTLPKDYDIRNDPVFNCHFSTYKRLMDIQHPVPEPTTSEMLRTGQCGPDPSSLVRGVFLRDIRENDLRPEPAYRMKLADRTSIHYMRADPLEGVLPYGRQGDMLKAKSVSHRDYKWRVCCPARPPCHPTMDRKVHRYAKTDVHGRDYCNKVVKFDDDCMEDYFEQKMMKLKKAYWWPKNPITNETLGGHLLYHHDDPCADGRHEIWPCGEKDVLECNPICIPEDRCYVLAHRPKERQKKRELNFYNKSYMDMRYPIRNYECFEEVPDCCTKPDQFPTQCCFTKGEIDLPCPKPGNVCPPKGPCPKVC